jgi:cell division septal protein FtsQ
VADVSVRQGWGRCQFRAKKLANSRYKTRQENHLPRQALKPTRSTTSRRRSKGKPRLGTDASFDGLNSTTRIGAWVRAKLLPLMGLAGILWLAIYLVSSPEYRINDVSVKGNSLIPSEELVHLASLQGQPILLANARGAEESIGKLKAVLAVTVRLEFPQRAVIEVAERPAAYVWKVKETLFQVSSDGIVLGTTPTANQPVVLVDVDGKELAVGDIVDADALATANTLRDLLPNALALTPAYFEYSHSEGVVLPTDFAGRVAFGGSDALENKVATLKAIRQTIQEKKLVVKFLDLRFPEKPYFR